MVLSAILSLGERTDGRIGSVAIRAGSFAIIDQGQIKGSSGSTQAGEIEIETSRDIRVDGTRSTGAFRMSGFGGGKIALLAGGDVRGSGRINIAGAGNPADAGSLRINSGGAVELTGPISARGGIQAGGGGIRVAAVDALDIRGPVDISGGDFGGGFLEYFSETSIRMGDVDASGGNVGGSGGFLFLSTPGVLNMEGSITALGAANGEDCGDAGEIDVIGYGEIVVAGGIELRGRGLDCGGGYITMEGGRVTVASEIDLSSAGPEGYGGELDVSADGEIRIEADVLTDAAGEAGVITLCADGDITVTADLLAYGRGSAGVGSSQVDLEAFGAVVLEGNIDVSGGASGDSGLVEILACSLTQAAESFVDATGASGMIDMFVNGAISLRGSWSAQPTRPAIVITYGPAGDPPDLDQATFNVAPVLELDPELSACLFCTSNAQCDDGNACTEDICMPMTGCEQIEEAAGTVCDDGDACTVSDFCADGVCQAGTAAICEDGDACTVNACDSVAGCFSEVVPNCPDSDGDGVGDADDACTTLDWTSEPTEPPNQHPSRMRLRLRHLARPEGEQDVTFAGFFNPASAGDAVEPHATGFHFVLSDDAGPLYEVNVPGGAAALACSPDDGWSVVTGETISRWTYRNLSGALPPDCVPGSARGLRVAQIRDLRSSSRAALRFHLKASDAVFEAPAARLTAELALGARQSTGAASAQAANGQCAEVIAELTAVLSGPPPHCKQRLRGGELDTLLCRGD